MRVLLFGDSLSDSDSSPGGRLAALLRDAGAEVRINARVGRSAYNFWRREDTVALVGADRAFGPELVIIWLGTNDAGLSSVATRKAMTELRDAYRGLPASVVAIGPPAFADQELRRDAAVVTSVMREVFGVFVDARPLSSELLEAPYRTGDGVHFTSRGAEVLAPRLRDALAERGGRREDWIAALVAVGLAAAIAVATK